MALSLRVVDLAALVEIANVRAKKLCKSLQNREMAASFKQRTPLLADDITVASDSLFYNIEQEQKVFFGNSSIFFSGGRIKMNKQNKIEI